MIQHKHLLVRAEILIPPAQNEMDFMDDWFKNLISQLGMKLLDGPHIKYVDVPGNRGLTGVSIIETSHIAMHIWDEETPSLMQLDVYTCGKMDVDIVFRMLEPFSPTKIEYKYLDRERGLHLLDKGTFNA